MQRVIALLGGSISSFLGIAAIAFAAGFLAQRAQFHVAGVPFVFIDYWAYVETGLIGFIRSASFLLTNFLLVSLLVGMSVGIICLLEWGPFRRFTEQPVALLAFAAVLALFYGSIVHQEVRVRRVATPETEPVGVFRDAPGKTVPVEWPFSAWVESPLEHRDTDGTLIALPADFPREPFVAWERMADDLENLASESSLALSLRPRPDWVTSEVPDSGAAPLLGRFARDEQLDDARALQLYRSLIGSNTVGLWGLLILLLWQRRVRQSIVRPDPTGLVLASLREEVWFSARWIMLPLTIAMASASAVVLLPESYGALAMPRIGNELLEVVVSNTEERQSTDDPAEDELDLADLMKKLGEGSAKSRRDKLRELSGKVDEYALADTEELQQLRDQFSDEIQSIEEWPASRKAPFLRRVVDMSEYVAPDLAAIAHDAWTRAAAGISRVGHILHYPRSETDAIRMISVNPNSAQSRWSIFPVKTEEVVEIRVRRDYRTGRAIHALRSMRGADLRQRMELVIELQLLGHPRTLEFMLGGLFDPSPQIVGAAATIIAAYASALPADTLGGRLRRQRAAEVLLRVVEDTSRSASHRGAAATALGRFMEVGRRTSLSDGEAGSGGFSVHAAGRQPAGWDRLLRIIEDPQHRESDPAWIVAGTVFTALGNLRVRQAAPSLARLMVDPPEGMPPGTRASIPSALALLGEHDVTLNALLEVMRDPASDRDLLGTAASAVARVARQGDGELLAPVVSSLLDKSGVPGDVKAAAVAAAALLADPMIAPLFRRLVSDADRGTRLRGLAIQALGSFREPANEQALLATLEDQNEPALLRARAALVLGRFGDPSVTRRMFEIARSEGRPIGLMIAVALQERSQAGESDAGRRQEELLDVLSVQEKALLPLLAARELERLARDDADRDR